jgi:hypothetical protein
VSSEIHVVPAKGGTSTALIRVKDAPFPLAWSADSKRIVYSEIGTSLKSAAMGASPNG